MDPDPLDVTSIPPGAEYVASNRGRLYFRVAGTAWHGIAPADRIWFASEREAREAGYEPSVVAPAGLDEFEIIEELGRGGAAVVYRARDRVLGREVAIKVIGAALHDDEETAGRFAREARILARLQHPHVVSVYAVKQLPTRGLALIMEYVPGRTLRDLIDAEGPLATERVESILRDVGGALAAAHRCGIVHRDVKPGNIFLRAATGHALLADFGIALPLDDPAKITYGGAVLGTPAYMSPEQIDGRDVDGRSDLYSLGLVGWEMLTGQAPWAGETVYGIIYKQKHENLASLRRLRPDLPDPIRLAIEAALAKDRDARPGGVEEFLSYLSGDARAPWWRRWSPGPLPRWVHTPPARLGSASLADAPTVRLQRGTDEAVVVAPAAPPASSPRRRSARVVAAAAVLLLGVGGIAAAMAGFRPPPEPRGYADAPSLTGTAPDAHVPPLPASALLATPKEVPTTDSLEAPDSASAEVSAGPPVAGSAAGGAAAAAPAEAQTRSGPAGELASADEEVPLLAVDRSRSLIATGGMHTCAIDPRGSLACWGGNERGQLGGADEARRPIPAPVDLGAVVSVAAGGSHTCVLDRQEVVRCWGDNREGQLGGETGGPGPSRVADRRFVSIAVGLAHTCGIARDGQAYCWGSHAHGQLGHGGSASRSSPVRVRTDERLVSLAAGWNHTCALSAQGRALCWGQNGRGQLGDGSTTGRSTPAQVLGDLRFRVLAAGSAHTCGLTTAGEALCWGQNSDGRLGDGSTSDRATPSRVRTPHRFAQIAAGGRHTCALTADGRAFCWGQNNYGQLGDGGSSAQPTPVPVDTEVRFATLRSSGSHTCAVGREGGTYCWGYNIEGQLGDGTLAHRATPHRVQSPAASSD